MKAITNIINKIKSFLQRKKDKKKLKQRLHNRIVMFKGGFVHLPGTKKLK